MSNYKSIKDSMPELPPYSESSYPTENSAQANDKVQISDGGKQIFSGSLEELKARDSMIADTEIYLLEQQFNKCLRAAKLIAKELEYRGYPITPYQQKELDGFREV